MTSKKYTEHLLIDACFYDHDTLPLITVRLNQDDFQDNRLKKVFAAIKARYLTGKPIDHFLIAQDLNDSSIDFPYGGEYYFRGMELGEHIERLKQQGQRKRLKQELKHSLSLLDSEKPLNEIQADISDNLFKILSENNQHKDRDIAQEVLSFYEQRKQERIEGKKYAGISTGINQLDNVLSGLLPGTLTVIGGRSSHGKTTFAQDIFFKAGKAGDPCLYISLEQTAKETFIFLLQKYTAIDPLSVKLGTATEAQESFLRDSIKRLSEYPFYFCDSISKLSDIILKIKSYAVSKKIKLLVIDYIQQIENHIKGEARHIEVAGTSRALKRLAMDLNISIVALSQLNKECESRAGNKIFLSDCRESEAIGHDADHVIFLNRPGLYGEDGADFIELAKNRNGQRVSRIPVKWNEKYNTYEELTSRM